MKVKTWSLSVKNKFANKFPFVVKAWAAIDRVGMWFLRLWFVMTIITGIGAVCVAVQVVTMSDDPSSNPAVIIGGLVCTIWSLLLAVFIYSLAAIDNKKSQADMTNLLAKIDALGDRADTGPLLAKIDALGDRADMGPLLAKIEDLEKQVKELSSSTKFGGQYENYEGNQDHPVVTTHTGKNYVISLYGRPRFLLTRLLPF